MQVMIHHRQVGQISAGPLQRYTLGSGAEKLNRRVLNRLPGLREHVTRGIEADHPGAKSRVQRHRETPRAAPDVQDDPHPLRSNGVYHGVQRCRHRLRRQGPSLVIVSRDVCLVVVH